MTTKKFILQFSEIGVEDLPRVGGKGANLGEMTKSGFPVPQGFCITTAAFEEFIKSTADSLYAKLDSVAIDDVENARLIGQEVRQALLNEPIPDNVKEATIRALKQTGMEYAYAVRSSATAEDLPDASFAGQQDTYLNVIGEEGLLDAIKKCWVSLFTDRAILYRTKNNFPHRDVKLSAVIQKMVMSERSGILFTADPLTGHRYTVAIDASFGLGEALVSGQVTPDTYWVDKRDGKILKRNISEKKLAIYPLRGGGTRKENIPPEKQQSVVMTDDEIRELVSISSNIEDHYGHPQDIEWAIEDGEIYILQTRPITSLYPIEALKYPEGKLGVFFSMGHQQNMLRPMTPLSISSFRTFIPFGKAEGRLESSLVRPNGSRVYIDLTPALRHRILRKIVFGVLPQFDPLAPQMLKQVMKRPEFRKTKGVHIRFSFIRWGTGIMRRVMYTLWRKDVTGFLERTDALIDEFVSEFSHRFDDIEPRGEMIKALLENLAEVFPFFLNWVPEAGAGIASTKMISKYAVRWLGDEKTDALTLGIQGNVVNDMNMMIGDLADVARHTPALVDEFDDLGDDALAWLGRAEKIEGSDKFFELWRTFIKKYGSRGPSEIDIYMPRWYENPMPVLKVIKEFLQREEGHHRSHMQSLIKGREEAYQELMSKASRGFFGRFRKWRYKRLYHVMTEVGGMREHHKFVFVQILAIVKEKLKLVASQLVDEGKFEDAEDIWFLTWPELMNIWEDDATDWRQIVIERRKQINADMSLTPPMILTSDGETPVVNYENKDAPEGALLGSAVSSGITEGIVHIIRDPTTESLAQGEILVTEFTDPGWTPLFINAKALVLEIGGSLSHGAVVAREYGIPAVVGVRGATKKLNTGQRVCVDGNRGIIEIL